MAERSAKRARKESHGHQGPAETKGNPGPRPTHAPTVREILSDELTALSLQHWAGDGSAAFDGALVERLYRSELLPALAPASRKGAELTGEDGQGPAAGEKGALSRLMLLELSRYLEKHVLH